MTVISCLWPTASEHSIIQQFDLAFWQMLPLDGFKIAVLSGTGTSC